MKRAGLLLSILLCFVPTMAHSAGTAELRPVFSLEWGYRASLFHIYHNNYLTNKGIRVDDRGSSLKYFSNGNILASAGIEFNKKYSACLCFGYEGIYNGRRIFPLTARFTYFPDSYDHPGLKVFADGGVAFARCNNISIIPEGKIGAGYHFPLNKVIAIDLSSYIEYVYDSPTTVYDKYDGSLIPSANLRKTEFSHFLLGLAISLVF